MKGALKTLYGTGLFLFPLKTLENMWLSGVFLGHRRTLVA